MGVVYSINGNWLYGGRYKTGATRADFDDSHFEKVTIPHSNCLLPWHSFDDKAYQFVSIYRRHLRLPAVGEKQRVFVDFAGVMTAAAVYLNGKLLGKYRGGYTPFSFELTGYLKGTGDNVLAVKVDSRERADIPPFGGRLDYLTFGGIYRDVALRVVNKAFVGNVFAKGVDVLRKSRRVELRCYLDGVDEASDLRIAAELCDGEDVLSSAEGAVTGEQCNVKLADLPAMQLWELDRPKLYRIVVRLSKGGKVVDEYVVRFGFRQGKFTANGFYLNGKRVKLRGLNRHQTFPFVGAAMPRRVQRRDALILKNELKCNIVRTSHYPQSRHFLDCCDEIGLLVFEEIPGWQHIGDREWQKLSCDNGAEMIRRDWNHPSIILWGVRINESKDNHEFYSRTNAMAHELDDSRQTGGVRALFDSELLEDVFTMNDFDPDHLRSPNHALYLNTEFCGHMFATKQFDNVERITEHVLRHARVHNMLGADRRFAGGIGWCAFDYNTHKAFGSGDRVCYHGVCDMFRIAKPAAGFYKSQCDPEEEIVLEPAFHWSPGDKAGGDGISEAVVCSNCDTLKFYVGEKLAATEKPDRKKFGNLRRPPFVCHQLVGFWPQEGYDLRIDGYIRGKKVISRTMSGAGIDSKFIVSVDDDELLADGSDMTRCVFRVTDEFGNARPFATGAVQIDLAGPGEIVGENPFALVGGCGAVWIRSTQRSGRIKLKLTHPVLGAAEATIRLATDSSRSPRVRI